MTLLTRNVQGLRIALLFATTVAKLMQFSSGALFYHVNYFHFPWPFFTFFLYYPYTSAGHCKTGQSQISSGNQLSTINIR